MANLGIEQKLVHVFGVLKSKYNIDGEYILSFHTDNYGGEAFYDHALETHEDAKGYTIRTTKNSFLTVPKESLKDYDKANYVEIWGDKIKPTIKSFAVR